MQIFYKIFLFFLLKNLKWEYLLKNMPVLTNPIEKNNKEELRDRDKLSVESNAGKYRSFIILKYLQENLYI